MYTDRCEHFLHFLNNYQLVWLEMQELIHKETGEIILPTYRDTLAFAWTHAC